MASFCCESMFHFFFFFPFFFFFFLFIHCVRVLNGNDGLLWPQLLLLEQQQPTKSENQKSKYYFQHRFDIVRFLGAHFAQIQFTNATLWQQYSHLFTSKMSRKG